MVAGVSEIVSGTVKFASVAAGADVIDEASVAKPFTPSVFEDVVSGGLVVVAAKLSSVADSDSMEASGTIQDEDIDS